MFRKTAVFIAILTLFAFVLGPTTSMAKDFAVGSTVENFSLPDTNGKVQSLSELKGKNGAVVVFLSAQCPVVKAYNERLSQLAADYEAKGITFIGINSNSTESRTPTACSMARRSFPHPYAAVHCVRPGEKGRW